MLKKSLMLVLLSVAASTAYANAPVNTDVQQDMINQPFSINATQWGYQFNNKSGKMMTFVLAVNQSSEGAVNLQCWHRSNSVENSLIQPGQISAPCVTDDSIRIVTADSKNLPATGTYSITLGS